MRKKTADAAQIATFSPDNVMGSTYTVLSVMWILFSTAMIVVALSTLLISPPDPANTRDLGGGSGNALGASAMRALLFFSLGVLAHSICGAVFGMRARRGDARGFLCTMITGVLGALGVLALRLVNGPLWFHSPAITGLLFLACILFPVYAFARLSGAYGPKPAHARRTV